MSYFSVQEAVIKPLSSRYRSILLIFILLLLALCSTVAVHYWQFRTDVNRYIQDQAKLIVAIPYQHFESGSVVDEILKPLSEINPVPGLVYAHILASDGSVSAEYNPGSKDLPKVRTDIDLENRRFQVVEKPGFREIYATLRSASDSANFIRLGAVTGFSSYVNASYRTILSRVLPVLIMVVLMLLMLKNSFKPSQSISEFRDRLLKHVPVENSLGIDRPEDDGDFSTLQHAISLTENYLSTVEEEKTTLNTSVKILAYQRSNAESILRSIPQGVLVLDELGQVIFVNQQFLRWYRLVADDVTGKMPGEWCERQDLLNFLLRYKGILARRAEVGEVEFDPPGKPGAYLSVTAYPMFSASNETQISSTLVVLNDVTSEIMAENARDEFAAAAAHELKTPLHSIGMHAEMLLSQEAEDSSVRIESANFINTEVEHIAELVRNMLNITRIETGTLKINRKLTKLNDLLDSTIENISSAAAENKVSLIKDYPETIEPSYLDKDLLRVAINNLLSNAIKYNKPGGEVKISLSETESTVTLTVADTGLGIGESEREKVFQKFFRSDDPEVRKRNGHGLGLSLVKEIIELHNGTISIESSKDEGSSFTVRLKRVSVPLKEVA